MTSINSVFASLLKALETTDGVLYVGWDESAKWPDGLKDILLKLGLLRAVSAVKQIECTGCEHRCFMGVESVITEHGKRSFIVCDVPEKQAEMGRILVTDDQLKRWRFSVNQLANSVHQCLEFDTAVETLDNGLVYRLGWLQGPKGRRKVSIDASSRLNMVVGSASAPLSEILYIEDNELQVDQLRLDEMLNAKSKTDKHYQPNHDKQTARKSKTQETYAAWQSAYLSLKKDHPTKSNTWISEKIAKMDIGDGRDAKTIYKNMKP